MFDWEDTLLEQNVEPSFCYGLFHEKPWDFTTPNHECCPEQAALLEDDILWWELTCPLPFNRFKRDVFELASRLIRSVDWRIFPAETPYEQLRDEKGSKASRMVHVQQLQSREKALTLLSLQQYESVFKTPFDEMDKEGPGGEGMFTALNSLGGNVAPEQLRRLFLRLLDPDPSMRPTAQQAAEELRNIQDRSVLCVHARCTTR